MDIKKRSSNLELLRIAAMLMIIAFHIYYHCISGQLTDADSIARLDNGWFSDPVFYKRLLPLTIFSSMGCTGNVIFMTLTGYFMVEKGTGIQLFPIAKKLLLQQGYAAVLLLFVSLAVFRRVPDAEITLTEIKLFNGMSWYVGYYFLVMLIARLFLNRYLARMDRNQYRLLLVALLCMTQFKWIIKLLNGITGNLVVLITGVFLYALGGYIRRYNPFGRVRVVAILGVIAAVYGLLLLSTYNGVENRIQDYVLSESTDLFQQYIPTVSDNQISAILLGVSYFELFRRLRLPSSRIINYIGSSTFMIYLIHDNSFFYSIWRAKDWITALYESPLGYLLAHLKWTLITFAMGFLAYCAYQLLGRVVRSQPFRCLVLRKPEQE